uniref:Uncharacterized protein n=1 Tax=Thermogemmatispora argillosa TaxID=2045280 RepID=A0A455SX58_9CHLR|nr:hypothetical protein KTA_03070 [Thermogemmatispora argillosa]
MSLCPAALASLSVVGQEGTQAVLAAGPGPASAVGDELVTLASFPQSGQNKVVRDLLDRPAQGQTKVLHRN